MLFLKLLPDVDCLFEKGNWEKYNTDDEEEFISENLCCLQKYLHRLWDNGKSKNVTQWLLILVGQIWGHGGSLYTIRDKDDNKNALVGNNVMLYNTKN